MVVDTLLIIVVTFLPIIVFFVNFKYQRLDALSPPILTLAESRRLLQRSTLAERAAPNRRLTIVFDIDNAFTTDDVEYHKVFVDSVRKMLKPAEADWLAIARQATQSLQIVKGAGVDINLGRAVQTIVFGTVVMHFFPGTQSSSSTDFSPIAKTINSLWVSSKTLMDGLLSPEQQHQQNALFNQMRNVFGLDPVGKNNPLNIILPAYETMWRVILRCFLEVRFREPSNGCYNMDQCRKVLAEFLHAPTQVTFKGRCDEDLTVEHLVDESLRLYPPTRRIYRETVAGPRSVDVEKLHRDTYIWGSNAQRFEPQRWRKLTTEQKQSFLPFGYGKYECPAKPLFGPMLIGIIVAVLVAEFDGRYELLGKGSVAVKQENPLRGGRYEYSGLLLRVRRER